MKKLIAQLMKFGVVGVIAFAIDYGLMVLLTEAFGVNYLLSATVSFAVSKRREFIIFVVLSVIGLGINDLIMWLGTGLWGISYLITKLVATFIVMVWNFITRKIFLDAGDEPVLDSLE